MTSDAKEIAARHPPATAGEVPAIRTLGLTKSYGKRRGVFDLDLEVRSGEIFGFLGPNGAGKTVTIRLLLDLIRPQSGRAEIFGLDSRREAVSVHRLVGYLPGELALEPRLTGRQLLTYLANLRGGVEWSFVEQLARRLELTSNSVSASTRAATSRRSGSCRRSCTGHLILVSSFFGGEDQGLAFDVGLPAGTLVVLLGYFWRDWALMVRSAAGDRAVGGAVRRLALQPKRWC